MTSVLGAMFCIVFLICCIKIETPSATKIPTVVLDLNEKFLDVMDHGHWFVMFYAPWCAHCKRLSPTWEHLGHALADRNPDVRVGKVDCTRFPSVASALAISAYPTLIFFRNGIRIPYEGDRLKESMLQFAEKSAGPVVQSLDKLSRFNELKKLSDKDPFFLLAQNPGAIEWPTPEVTSGDEEPNLKKAYEQIAENLFTEVRFLSVAKTFLQSIKDFHFPDGHEFVHSVIVVKDRHYEFYGKTGGEDLRNWVDIVRWPLLPQVTSANIYTIANSSKKKLVLMVGDATEMIGRTNMSTETGRFYAMFKKAATLSYSDSHLSRLFQFGWIDDVSLIKNVIMGEISLPSMIVFNLTSYEFYLNGDDSKQITEHSLQTFLYTLSNGNITVLGGRSWPTRIRRIVYEVTTNVHDMFYHQPILTLCLFGVPLAFFSIISYSVCSADFSVDRNEIYPDDEEEEDDDGFESYSPNEDEAGDNENNNDDRRSSYENLAHGEESEVDDVSSETELIKDSIQKKSD